MDTDFLIDAYNVCMYRQNTLFKEQLSVLLNVLA